MAKPNTIKGRYNRVLEAYREDPSHPYTVARRAEVDPRTAIKAWELGWPKKGLEPIRTVFAREQQKARAEILAKQATNKAVLLKEREDAVAQAAKARAEEGQMVAWARGSALQAMTVAVSLAVSARKLAGQVKQQIDALAELAPGDPSYLTASQGLTTLQRIADLLAKIDSVAATSMQMERLHLGQPTNITANVITSQTEMTIEEAAARIEMAQKALEGARRVGGLTVIDGGLKEPVIGKKVENV
jgi:hypothetical protein